MIADFETCDAFTHFNNDASAFVAKDRRKDAFWVIARTREFICMAKPSCFDFNKNFSGLWAIKFDFHDLKWLTRFERNGCFSSHVSPHISGHNFWANFFARSKPVVFGSPAFGSILVDCFNYWKTLLYLIGRFVPLEE